jgi:N-acetylglucosamine kinase-like BadF-type ATPase
MILIADGGSTKVDWIALDQNKQEIFRTRSKGLNPALLSAAELQARIDHNFELTKYATQLSEVHFYGAGCGTPKPTQKLKDVLQNIFKNAEITVAEDMLGAVYAASKGKESIVCILGTGSNSCYYDGVKMHQNVQSLGYILMDEASGNYFGKKLLQDYYYKRMPREIAIAFETKYDVGADEIKRNLYQTESPNAYLGQFAEFMFDFKDSDYMHKLIANGFTEFIENRVVPYEKYRKVPVYFIGSIAYFFEAVLEEICQHYGIHLQEIIRRPIDRLIDYHKNITR